MLYCYGLCSVAVLFSQTSSTQALTLPVPGDCLQTLVDFLYTDQAPSVTGNTLVLVPPISVPLQSQVTHLFWYLLSLKSEIPLRAFNYYLLSLSNSTHQRCDDADSWNIRLSCERLGVQIQSETDLSHENK